MLGSVGCDFVRAEIRFARNANGAIIIVVKRIWKYSLDFFGGGACCVVPVGDEFSGKQIADSTTDNVNFVALVTYFSHNVYDFCW